ncbi:hypothetical protein RJ639_018392 [Escallonia herrerae]|uniref:Proteasome component Ecm29 N-terminal domain-containing protein n=1 Tax=Escallonia herrerae TaxID=1293975 RepID=A0AA88V955_9ASTE|nr:hypothetical protein RJ639_018392 [Escallonia herrerae]
MAESSSSLVLPQKSDAEIEEMLDRMLTRLALCDDSKLQNLLSKLLPLSISSLSSHSPAVRNKVIEILSHVNKRVKHQPEIGLPLSELWKLYMAAEAAPMVKNFCIVYIEMAFERTSEEEKQKMAPVLVANISKLPLQHQEIILRISIKSGASSSWRFWREEGSGSAVGLSHIVSCPQVFAGEGWDLGFFRALKMDVRVDLNDSGVDPKIWQNVISGRCVVVVVDCDSGCGDDGSCGGCRDVGSNSCLVLVVIGDCHSRRINDEVAAKYSFTGAQDREIFVEFCLHTVLYQPPSQGGGCPAGLSVTQSTRISGKHPLKYDKLLIMKLGILNVIEAMDLALELVYPLYVAACADCQEPVVKRGEELLKKKASGVNLDDTTLINRLFLLFNALDTRRTSAEEAYSPGEDGGPARIEQLKLMGPVILNGILKSLDGYSASESGYEDLSI